ncbi:unnamed protein product [Hermetia illucens]|uniref:Sorting nexin-13 n=1 Tax=Hermetia illucens TaxID=343691 RepID=A0A7R8Z3S3_HERIL|nr:sorting nexin-13-like isoform X2 [Hermetia illucens]CAD7092282.1 unnamed protein product [Hermetia illucens]
MRPRIGMISKHYSWIFAILAFLLHILGIVKCLALLIGICFFVLGVLCIIYVQHGDLDQFLENSHPQNPLEPPRPLGLNLGIELLFKKHSKNVREGHLKVHDVYLESREASPASSGGKHANTPKGEEKKWKPFDNIKIYSEKKKPLTSVGYDKQDAENVSFGEDVSMTPSPRRYNPTFSHDGHLLDEHGSPKRKQRAMLSGNKPIDQRLHTIIDYIIRDFIDSWFCSLSDNKEFSDYRVRNCIEECVTNICARAKNVQWIPLMTTKLIENVANHTRFYRLANQAINSQNEERNAKHQEKKSPQRKSKKSQHKRNKSDTDLEWYFGSSAAQKSVANSKFYTEPVNEKVLTDPEANLITAFFNQCDTYKKECMDDRELEKHLTNIMETVLYFTLPEEDFACIPLRTFLSTLLANVFLKPILDMLSDPDFLNLQVARLFSKETPPVEYFIKALRQSTDLSELRACRQLITKHMNLKYKDHSASAEVASLKYTQKLIDLRINYLQSNKDISNVEMSRLGTKLPLLSLDELLLKELAQYYFLDYLSALNLQKYVIFYVKANDWKSMTNRHLAEVQSNKYRGSREELYKNLREKANEIFKEYLQRQSENCLDVDGGLIEALSIKLRDHILPPDGSWFDSISKFVYEKLKNEDIFLNKFYQSSAYRSLLLELEFVGHGSEPDVDNPLQSYSETGSDSNSGDINFDDDLIGVDIISSKPEIILPKPDLLEIANFKHCRSHSDCTGIVPSYSDLNLECVCIDTIDGNKLAVAKEPQQERAKSAPTRPRVPEIQIDNKQKLTAKIINTAILCEGQYAVYAIQVVVVEDNQQKSWHIYRRYSKFLELKKILTKKYPAVSKIPFPAKKTFHNTQRAVLEHRMVLLNDFLSIICEWAADNDDMMRTVREFLEPDTDDRKIHGGVVIRTIETLVNPLKTGMRTIRNMPDTLVGGFSKLLLGKGPLKEPSFLEVNYLEQSSEYPALAAALHLLDEVFDLQARSQWLRRGLINRVLGAPWVSQTANKKIIQAAKSLIEVEKIDHLLGAILNSLWPEGKRMKQSTPREDNTKLRTRVAARMALFALLSDDLKHVVGSETTRAGLLNFFTLWQQKKLNLRLALILLNDILTTLYGVDSMTKHVKQC